MHDGSPTAITPTRPGFTTIWLGRSLRISAHRMLFHVTASGNGQQGIFE